ncbi:50S ribosomal protein L33 [Trifolium repens]|nr:50S ribosomal protein L33 [Trifolium repens]
MGSAKKKAQMFVKLVSAAGTGFFYVKRKPRQFTEKLEFRKYDPRVNRHVLFTEAKMKLNNANLFIVYGSDIFCFD